MKSEENPWRRKLWVYLRNEGWIYVVLIPIYLLIGFILAKLG